MLHALPFTTFGEAAALGLDAHVYCPSCFRTRQIDPTADHLHHRYFATTRFRCANVRLTGKTCGGPGSVTVRPAELLPVGGDVKLAFLLCERCLPPWYINHIPTDRPPWIIDNWPAGDRFRCPGCGGAVRWQIHGRTWRPFANDCK